MHRVCFAAVLLVSVSSCHIPPEQLPLQPVPQDGTGMTYAEVVLRARLQAGTATEAFYVDHWKELAGTARIIEETARLLVMTSAVPVGQKDRLNAHSEELAKAAAELRKGAEAQDVKHCTEALQRINLKVREMRPEG
jgi:hypothetical protein